MEKPASDLNKDLGGKDMLNGWHVLVAYHEDDLNRLLKERHDQLDKEKRITDVPEFEAQWESVDGDFNTITVHATFKLQLGRPALSFIEKKQVQLQFPLSGKWGAKDKLQNSLKDGLYLTCRTDLVKVKGSIADKDNPAVTPPGAVVSLESDKKDEAHVVIDLRNPNVEVTNKDGVKDTGPGAVVNTHITPHIQTVGLQYSLIGMTTNAESRASGVQLKPSKFVVTTVTPNDKASTDRAALLMWIAVEDMPDNTRDDSENSPLLFKPDGINQISPIPNDKNASIYIARDVVYNLFMKSALTKAGFSNVQWTELVLNFQEGVKFGLGITATPPSIEVICPSVTLTNLALGGRSYLDGFKFDLNLAQFQLALTTLGLLFVLSHKYLEAGITEESYHVDKNAQSHRDMSYGSCDISMSASSLSPWSDTKHSEEIKLEVQMPDHFNCEADNPSNPSIWRQWFGSALKPDLSNMTRLKIPLPQFHLDFGAIDYFLATNLLFPGQHVFKSGNASGDLFVPRDLVVFGSVVEELA